MCNICECLFGGCKKRCPPPPPPCREQMHVWPNEELNCCFREKKCCIVQPRLNVKMECDCKKHDKCDCGKRDY